MEKKWYKPGAQGQEHCRGAIKGFGSVVVTKIDSTHNVGLLVFTSVSRTTIQPLQDIKGFAGDVGEKLKPAAQMVRDGSSLVIRRQQVDAPTDR